MGDQLHVQDALMERKELLVYDLCAGFRAVPEAAVRGMNF